MNQESAAQLARRVDALERSQRRLRAGLAATAVALACALGAACLSGAQAQPGAQALRVRSLDVVNERGDVVVHLGARSSGAGGFWLTNAGGTRVLKINQDERGGRITLLTEAGSVAGTLGVDKRGVASLGPASTADR